MNVLWWIRGRSRIFKPFVANRVGEIQSLTNPKQLRFVPTNENRADFTTRGMRVSDLANEKKWWSGPDFLQKEESDYNERQKKMRHFRYLSICFILFASSVKSLIPPPPKKKIKCCVGAVVCAVEELEKSALFRGKGGANVPKTPKIEFYCQVSQHFCRSL